jgi:hypothetical protein
MTEDGFLGIRPAGRDMESFCCACGEPLLISPGDVVHFKRGGELNIMGMAVPMPQGLLCSVCNKQENGEEGLTVKFARLACSICGEDLRGDLEPEFDDEGNLKEMFCEGCSEPWRNKE